MRSIVTIATQIYHISSQGIAWSMLSKDETVTTSFIIFDPLAEKVVSIPIAEVLKQIDQVGDTPEMPLKIMQQVGNTFNFLIKFTYYNAKFDVGYTVIAMSELQSIPKVPTSTSTSTVKHKLK